MPHLLARWRGRLLALLSGAGLALAFPPVSAWWWAWVGLVPLLALCGHAGSYRQAAWYGWFAAVGFFTTAHYWVLAHLEVFAAPAVAVIGLAWLPFGLAAYGLLRAPSVRRVLAAMVVLPSVWVAVEALRSWKHLGGGWGLLGLSQWNAGPVLAVASLGGVWLLSFLLVAVNVAVTALVLTGVAPHTRLVAAVSAAAIAVAAVGYGLLRPDPTTTGVMRIAGVQPGVIHGERERIAAHLELTHDLADRDHDVIVWGQSSVGLDPAQHPAVARRLRHAAAVAGSDLLVNVDAAGPAGRTTKATYQYTGDGLQATYTKQRLAPFGEYIPLRPLLGWLAHYTKAPATDRATGEELTTLDVGGHRVGTLISYESTFPDMRRNLVRMGADVTIVQGSLTTFQNSWAHPQQASMEAVRAVESGRPAVLVALSGTSAAFDARGRQLDWVPPGHRDSFIVEVPLSAERTPYVRLGDWAPALSWLILALAAATLAIRAIGRRLGRERSAAVR